MLNFLQILILQYLLYSILVFLFILLKSSFILGRFSYHFYIPKVKFLILIYYNKNIVNLLCDLEPNTYRNKI